MNCWNMSEVSLPYHGAERRVIAEAENTQALHSWLELRAYPDVPLSVLVFGAGAGADAVLRCWCLCRCQLI